MKSEYKILITGASGMLGTEVSKLFPNSTKISGREQLDLANIKSVQEFLNKNQYETIIHLAAITNLNRCRDNPHACDVVHNQIVDLFNERCTKLIYVSTVPVWNKRSVTKEKDPYFYTKKQGEKKTLEKDSGLVIRTNIVGSGGLSKWAIETVSNGDQIFGYTNSFFNPVHTKQLSQFIYESYKEGHSGLQSVFGDTIMSKYEFIEQLLKKKNLDLKHLKEKTLQENEDLVYYTKNSKIFEFEKCLEML